jgi:D-glycero-alpha-D-manno-heptose-7-phosphate kinase
MVALLHALHTIKDEEVSPIQLSEEAFEIENRILKSQVGKQDQYASAFGGMNHFIFYSTGRVKCEPIVISREIKEFFRDSLLLWTEIERPANEILSEQANQVEEKLNYYRLKSFADQIADLLTGSRTDLSQISRIIRESWDLKRKLSDGIANERVNSISSHLDELRLSGHKLLGAGAGGFFLVLEVGRQYKELQKLYKTLEFEIDQKGSRVIHILR